MAALLVSSLDKSRTVGIDNCADSESSGVQSFTKKVRTLSTDDTRPSGATEPISAVQSFSQYARVNGRMSYNNNNK